MDAKIVKNNINLVISDRKNLAVLFMEEYQWLKWKCVCFYSFIVNTLSFVILEKVCLNLAFSQKKYPKNKPLVSIIITSFNYGAFINEAVNSVLNQTYQNFEILIVDGGSTDNKTAKILKKINNSRIKKYFLHTPAMVGRDRNYGIAKAKGKYICCLDADDKLHPTYLQKCLYTLEILNYDVVSSGMQMFGDRKGIYFNIARPTLSDFCRANRLLTAVFKKELWKKAGGYRAGNEGGRRFYEDWDFWARLSALGARVYNIREPLVYLRLHKTNHTKTSNPLTYAQHIKLMKKMNSKMFTPFAFIRSNFVNKHIMYTVNNALINLIG